MASSPEMDIGRPSRSETRKWETTDKKGGRALSREEVSARHLFGGMGGAPRGRAIIEIVIFVVWVPCAFIIPRLIPPYDSNIHRQLTGPRSVRMMVVATIVACIVALLMCTSNHTPLISPAKSKGR
jgi:hypothetical protein